MSLIEINDVTKRYHKGEETITPLDGVTLQIEAGEFLSLMGASGTGKSTLLNLIASIDRPDRGSIVVDGVDITRLSRTRLARWRAANMGYIFQTHNLIPVLTAHENIELPLLLLPMSRSERRRRVEIALEAVHLLDRAEHYPRQLSGGQEQRVGIARAIVAHPKVVVADEPTGDLDPDTSAQIIELLKRLNQQLQVTLLAGSESNDIITLQKESYSTAGINVEWRPSPYTRVFVGVEDRYFGTGHNIALEHRTGRTVWTYTDSRGVVNNPLQEGAASLGSVYDLLDSLYTQIQPNPVLRAQLVQAELLRLGLPANALIFQNFLTSSATLDRVQRLSVALSGIRSVWTLSVYRSDSSRLDTVVSGGDDFDLNTDIEQQGWSLTYAHRLTPLTSLNAGLTNQKSAGSSGLNLRSTTASVGLGTRLSRRTSVSVQLQRGNYSGSSGNYNDTAISGFITHRF